MARRGVALDALNRERKGLLRKKIRTPQEAPPAAPVFAPLRKKPGAAQIVSAARRAGVTDEFDGAPVAETLASLAKRGVDVLAARGFDDDPFSVGSEAVLRESAGRVAAGLRLAARACGAGGILVAASCRDEARRFSAAEPDVPAAAAGPRYPASLFLLRKLRRGGKKVAFLGAQACAALADAAEGKPQEETVVTAAGDGFREPGNYRVRIGAPVREVLRAAGISGRARLAAVRSAVSGDALADDSLPVAASTRCVVALLRAPAGRVYPCVRCGRCARACPVGVVPWLIHRELESGDPDALLFFHAGECVGCRACSLVCPSGIALAEEVALAAERKEGGAK